MKLHLGCGEQYLKDYINIDFSIDKHTVQKQTVADQLIDIQDLKYSPKSIEEIRLHHVLEHFPRAIVCAFLTSWNIWLERNGKLRIEVPDFSKMSLQILSPFSTKRKKLLGNRHIFGSQEAPWATHFVGYTTEGLTYLLKTYGFKIDKIKKNNWKNTYNIEIFASKKTASKTVKAFELITKKYLELFLLDNSNSELRLLKIWMKIYKSQINKCFK
jgi:predicted SAM-dependent methyltransferase